MGWREQFLAAQGADAWRQISIWWRGLNPHWQRALEEAGVRIPRRPSEPLPPELRRAFTEPLRLELCGELIPGESEPPPQDARPWWDPDYTWAPTPDRIAWCENDTLEPAREFPNLDRLDLRFSRVRELGALDACPSLELLCVDGTALEPGALDAFRRAHPSCRVTEHLGARLSWTRTDDAELPYAAQVDGRAWQVRINEFPVEPHVYSLLIDGREAESFDDWPRHWSKPG